MSQRVASAIQLPVFAHLRSLTDGLGLFEHALYSDARVEHGYCTDDVARALVVVLREDQADPAFAGLTEIYLTFLERAVVANGTVHNRMSAAGSWTDEPTTDDCWGRAVAALGTAARCGSTKVVRDRAVKAFLRAAKSRTREVRSACFAAIGAAELIRTRAEGLGAARALLADCLALIPRRAYPGWDWPEPRLRYANAALCDALIVGGTAMGHPQTVRQGVSLLTVLLRLETGEFGQLSVCGTKGRGPGDSGPMWDQQPIEVAAIADACAHAFAVTGDVSWRRAVQRAWGWFNAENDSGVQMYDPATGAGYDGLEIDGRNENCGAESTLAALTTLQRALDVSGVR